MITRKISKDLEKLIAQIDLEHETITVIEELSNIHDSFEKDLLKIINQYKQGIAGATHEAFGTINSSLIQKVENTIRRTRFSKLNLSLEKIRNSINTEIIKDNYEILLRIDTLTEFLDFHLHKPTTETSFALTKSAYNLMSLIHEIIPLSHILNSDSADTKTSNPSLTIYLSEKPDIETFSKRISAIGSILEICCKLLGMSIIEGQVEIEKIESGSIFAEISANPLVISLATIIVTKGADHLFNSIGKNKKNEAFRENSENLEKIFGLRNFLSENGLNTTEIDEEIKKHSLMLARQLDNLFENQSLVEINEKTIKNSASMQLPKDHRPSLEELHKEPKNES